MNAYFKALSNCSHQLDNKINRSHEKCLAVTYEDQKASFEEPFEMEHSVSVHYKNLQCLAIELYKVSNGIFPDILKDAFPFTFSNCNIRNR